MPEVVDDEEKEEEEDDVEEDDDFESPQQDVPQEAGDAGLDDDVDAHEGDEQNLQEASPISSAHLNGADNSSLSSSPSTREELSYRMRLEIN